MYVIVSNWAVMNYLIHHICEETTQVHVLTEKIIIFTVQDQKWKGSQVFG